MKVNALTVKGVAAISASGYYTDGAGLVLQVSSSLTKSWIYRYTVQNLDAKAGRKKKIREMGLGSVRDVSLAQARQLAAACRQQRLAGKDPIDERNAARKAAQQPADRSLSFAEAFEQYVAANHSGWKNKKHIAQWRSTIETYAAPHIAAKSVDNIDTAAVMKVLLPIWLTKTETASRVRGRIETVLDWAAVAGHRQGDNPARWRGHLEHSLPAPSKVKKVKNHPALPYGEINAFFAQLTKQQGVASRALEFAILTAARTGEVLEADWREINFDHTRGPVWTVPAERMKAKKEHWVPLSASAVRILERTPEADRKGFLFPGQKKDRPLSNMSMSAVLERMNRENITVHGFRSTFRDWAAEQSTHSREVIEHALAHQLKDKAEASYQRGTLLDKRRELMRDWAAQVTAKT